MSSKDFKIETDFYIEDVGISFNTVSTSGGLLYDESTSTFASSDTNIPVGVVRLWASGSTSPTVPDDYLICDGRQDLSQTTYARLYAVIGDRFTTSPNGSTFGIPYFNSSSIQYPFVVGIDDANDVANAGVYQQTSNQTTTSIGPDQTTSHTHTAGASFVANVTSSTSLSHGHNAIAATDNHSHGFSSGNSSGTSHNHNSGNASLNHSHNYNEGNVGFVETGGPSANHTHSYGGESENHAHNSSNQGHTHGTNGPSGLSSNTHSHGFTSGLSGNSTSHAHQVDTSGFYFIIRYQ